MVLWVTSLQPSNAWLGMGYTRFQLQMDGLMTGNNENDLNDINLHFKWINIRVTTYTQLLTITISWIIIDISKILDIIIS